MLRICICDDDAAAGPSWRNWSASISTAVPFF